jgi:hypothetical protein
MLKENGARNSFPYLLLLFSGGETLKNFQARFLELCELKTTPILEQRAMRHVY